MSTPLGPDLGHLPFGPSAGLRPDLGHLPFGPSAGLRPDLGHLAIGPLQKRLAAHGIRLHPWAIVEACGGDLSLPSFARFLRSRGLEARLFEVHPGDLAFFRTGTLVAFDAPEAGLATVIAQGASGPVVERADGSRGPLSAEGPSPRLALDVGPAEASGRGLAARLASHLRHEPRARGAVVLAGLVGIALALLGVAMPILTQVAMGLALPSRAPHTLALAAVATALVGVQLAYVGWLRRRALLFLTSKLAERATLDLAGHLLRLPFAELRRINVGQAQQVLGSASNAAEAYPALGPQIVDSILGLAYLAYTCFLDPLSGGLTAAAGVLMLVVGLVGSHGRIEQRRSLLSASRAQQQCLYETLAGIETVKHESVEGRFLARWIDFLLVEQRLSRALRLEASTVASLLQTITNFVFGGVLLLVARRCLANEASVADLIVAVQASASFMRCAQMLAQLPPRLVQLRIDLERTDEILAKEVEDDRAAVARPRAAAHARAPGSAGRHPAIVLRDVWFRYEENAPWVLSGVDLAIEAGERIQIPWSSGAGKSTLLRLLAGLLSPTRGDVLIEGTSATAARRRVAYVPQSASLFPGSVIENLRILSDGATDERITLAAEATGLSAQLATWPMGLDTIVALGSTNLSTGQKQLVLFTAAVASEAPVVLLDEALAHVDHALRARMRSHCLFEGRTVIAVAHDPLPGENLGARTLHRPPGGRPTSGRGSGDGPSGGRPTSGQRSFVRA